jgi:hypothetical protein
MSPSVQWSGVQAKLKLLLLIPSKAGSTGASARISHQQWHGMAWQSRAGGLAGWLAGWAGLG